MTEKKNAEEPELQSTPDLPPAPPAEPMPEAIPPVPTQEDVAGGTTPVLSEPEPTEAVFPEYRTEPAHATDQLQVADVTTHVPLKESAVDDSAPQRRGTGLTTGLVTDYRVVQRIDPWSVMKYAFLMSIALGVMMVIAAALGWLLLDSLGVFSSITEIVGEVDTTSGDIGKLLGYLHFDKVISLSTVIAGINVLLLTALATICAFLYNVIASLVGGIHVTLVEE